MRGFESWTRYVVKDGEDPRLAEEPGLLEPCRLEHRKQDSGGRGRGEARGDERLLPAERRRQHGRAANERDKVADGGYQRLLQRYKQTKHARRRGLSVAQLDAELSESPGRAARGAAEPAVWQPPAPPGAGRALNHMIAPIHGHGAAAR